MIGHIDAQLRVDFDRCILGGSARLQLREPWGGGELALHARGLDIGAVEHPVGTPLPHRSGAADPVHGEGLHVELPAGAGELLVRYATRPGAEGLQWLPAGPAAGGAPPFLYTQGQSIHTRSWLPCVDDPSVRMTWSLELELPPGLTAVAAAGAEGRDGDRWRFHMPQPVPAYLVAFAAGELAFTAFDDRSGVWAPPGLLDAAAGEFAGTPDMIATAESLFGPYRWGRYDLLVLPPSFPLGGMENPRLTFATPTVITGDRSLVALVAHELAHSWSGNLVTNSSWDDFWINEGTTVYIERRILEALYGRERSEMEAAIGRMALERILLEKGPDHPDTRLRIPVGDRDPDELMSPWPYEKGYLLWRHLEELCGREAFDRFLRGYFDRHAFGTMDSDTLVAELRDRLLAPGPGVDAVDLAAWIDQPGLPDDAPRARSEPMERARRAGAAAEIPPWLAQATTPEWLQYLGALPRGLETGWLAALDRDHDLSRSSNRELQAAWLVLATGHGLPTAERALEDFVGEVGRMKFLEPIYRRLRQLDDGRARSLYDRHREGYHAMARKRLDAILR